MRILLPLLLLLMVVVYIIIGIIGRGAQVGLIPDQQFRHFVPIGVIVQLCHPLLG
jgi:hypothetical protein